MLNRKWVFDPAHPKLPWPEVTEGAKADQHEPEQSHQGVGERSERKSKYKGIGYQQQQHYSVDCYCGDIAEHLDSQTYKSAWKPDPQSEKP